MRKVYDRILDYEEISSRLEQKNVALGELASIEKKEGEKTFASVLKLKKI